MRINTKTQKHKNTFLLVRKIEIQKKIEMFFPYKCVGNKQQQKW